MGVVSRSSPVARTGVPQLSPWPTPEAAPRARGGYWMSGHCVLKHLLLDCMGWWAPVGCGMSVHCVLHCLLLDVWVWSLLH